MRAEALALSDRTGVVMNVGVGILRDHQSSHRKRQCLTSARNRAAADAGQGRHAIGVFPAAGRLRNRDVTALRPLPLRTWMMRRRMAAFPHPTGTTDDVDQTATRWLRLPASRGAGTGLIVAVDKRRLGLRSDRRQPTCGAGQHARASSHHASPVEPTDAPSDDTTDPTRRRS